MFCWPKATKMEKTFLDEKLPVVKVHATVLFSILNHFMRRKEDRKDMRVVGSILGVVSEGCIEITNSFPLIHDEHETKKEFQVNLYDTINIGSEKINYYDDMVRYHESIDRRDSIIGWYCTSVDGALDDCAKLIDESVSVRNSECQPVGLLVSTALELSDRINARAYVGEDVTLGNEILAKVFHELNVQMIFSPGESLCIQHMLASGNKDSNEPWQLSTKTKIHREEYNVNEAIFHLRQMISKINSYIDKAIEDPDKASVIIGKELADTIALLQEVQTEPFAKTFHEKSQNLLMVQHLNTILQTQIELAEKMYLMI